MKKKEVKYVEFSCNVKKFSKYKDIRIWDKKWNVEDFRRCWKNWVRNKKFSWVDVMLLDEKDKVIGEYVWYEDKGWIEV